MINFMIFYLIRYKFVSEYVFSYVECWTYYALHHTTTTIENKPRNKASSIAVDVLVLFI